MKFFLFLNFPPFFIIFGWCRRYQCRFLLKIWYRFRSLCCRLVPVPVFIKSTGTDQPQYIRFMHLYLYSLYILYMYITRVFFSPKCTPNQRLPLYQKDTFCILIFIYFLYFLQVEVNNGAAGGHMADHVTQLHRRLLSKAGLDASPEVLPENHTLDTLARGIYLAWYEYSGK